MMANSNPGGRGRAARRAQRAKVALRRAVADHLAKTRLSVLDCFAEAGTMFDDAWHDAAAYCAIEADWRPWYKHRAFCADNRRALRCIDLSAYNVFDLDAKGSPWEQATIIAARRKLGRGERVALAISDGSAARSRKGALDWRLAALAGVDASAFGIKRDRATLTARAIAEIARRMGGEVEEIWQVEDDGRATVYCAAVIRALEGLRK